MSIKEKIGWGVAVGVLFLLMIIILVAGKDDNQSSNDTKTLSNDVNVILKNAQEESAKVTDSEKKEFEEINADTYLEYYGGEETRIILIARPTCGYCQVAEPILHKLAKDYDLAINYLNTDNFQGDDLEKVKGSDEFLKDGFGTPVLMLVGQGKMIDKVDGLTDTAHYIDFFTRNQIIHEGE